MPLPEVLVAPATLEEVVAVHARIPEFDAGYITDNIGRPDLAIMEKNPCILAARVNGVAAGYMIGYDRTDVSNTMHIWLNGTDPNYRGRGVFGALLGNLAEEAQARGHESLTVMSNRDRFPNMIGTLVASGFEVTDDIGGSVRFQKHLA